MSKFLIYALHHPDSRYVYVGKSTQGMRRPQRHGYPSNMQKCADYPLTRWITKYRATGSDYQIVILETHISPDLLDEAERFYIAYFRSVGVALLNITDGGDGALHTTATKEKIRLAHKG